MKKYLIAGTMLAIAIDLSGCTPGNNVPGSTAAGAIAGGLIGSQVFHNTTMGAIGGALLGGVIGDAVGNAMDKRDEEKMQSAVTTVPVGQEAEWTNSHGTQYVVRPVKNYTSSSGSYCREYQTMVTVNGKVQKAYGRACRQPDGSWKIVS